MSQEEQLEHEFQEEVKTHGGKVRVTVIYVNTSTEVSFRMPTSATLKDVFDQAYRELKEQPRAGDKYLCHDGTDLSPHLGSTLEQLHRQKICRRRHFQIASETGGA